MQKLSKDEMKKVMGGLIAPSCSGSCDYTWTDANNNTHTTAGSCETTQGGLCYCSSGEGQC